MHNLVGIFCGIIPMIFLYSYTYSVLKETNCVDDLRLLSKKELLCLLLMLLGLVGVTTVMLQRNSTIYYWDSAMHWMPSVDLSKLLFSDIKGLYANIWYSINNSDYNNVIPYMHALPVRVFGNSFIATIVISQIFYLFPSLIIIAIFERRVMKHLGFDNKSVCFYVLFLTLVPVIENVLVIGFLDGPVLLVSTLILLLVYDLDYQIYSLKKCILIAVGLIFIMVARRHWMYWTIALIVYMVINACWQIIKQNKKLVLKNGLKTCFSISIIDGFILFVPLRQYVNYSFKNYGDIYAAWNGSIGEKIHTFVGAFGVYSEIFIISAVILMFLYRKKLETIIGLTELVIFPVYIMNKSIIMHDAHFYLIVVPFFTIIIAAFEYCLYIVQNKWKRVISVISFACVSFIFLNYSFSDSFNICNGKVYSFIFRQNTGYQVKYRDDIETLKRLVADINSNSEKYDAGVYICAASDTLNASLLVNVNEPESFYSINRFLPGSYVDLRDGFSNNFFEAKLLVTESPTPPLDDEYSKSIYGVSWHLSEQVADVNSAIGKHYKLLESYDLDYGQKAHLYLKVSDYSKEDLDIIIDFYDKLYPDNKEIFSNRIKSYKDSLYNE